MSILRHGLIRSLLALIAAAPILAPGVGSAAIVERTVAHSLDGVDFESKVVFDESVPGDRPAVLMIPNWMGMTAGSLEKAKKIADMGYVVFMADIYGVDVRPKTNQEAAAAAGTLRNDLPLMRARMDHVMNVMLGSEAPIDDADVAAIGFCFGGGAVLELARSGRVFDAAVSFHGNLNTSLPARENGVKASVLVLHGAEDPLVPVDQVNDFRAEMIAADADWQLIAYGNAVHSFTNPAANVPGQVMYNALVAERAFRAMNDHFAEVFAAD